MDTAPALRRKGAVSVSSFLGSRGYLRERQILGQEKLKKTVTQVNLVAKLF